MKTFNTIVTMLFFAVGLPIALNAMTEFDPQSQQPGQPTQGTWYDKKLRDRGAKPGEGVIYFYNSSDESNKPLPYYEFTNFFELSKPVKIDGYVWNTTEQYYQAGKFSTKTPLGVSIRDLIRTGQNSQWKDRKPANKSWGAWAFYIANQAPDIKAKAAVRSDWTDFIPALSMKRNINRMLVALRAKFTADKNLGQMLLKTYPKILVEDSPKDGYFGAGNPTKNIPQGTGENLLGRLLMHVRKELYKKFILKDPSPESPFDDKNDFSLNYLLKGGKI